MKATFIGPVWLAEHLKEVLITEKPHKVGDTVIATKGPHKGEKHTVIHDHGDGRYNVKPQGLHPRQIKYRQGAASAKGTSLTAHKSAKNEEAPVSEDLILHKASWSKPASKTAKYSVWVNFDGPKGAGERVVHRNMSAVEAKKMVKDMHADSRVMKKHFHAADKGAPDAAQKGRLGSSNPMRGGDASKGRGFTYKKSGRL